MAIHGRLVVWFNAFLAKDISGVTETVKVGVHKGKTVIPLPGYAKFPLNANRIGKDIGYLTDQRGFSSKITANSRIQSITAFNLDTVVSAKTDFFTSGTTEVDMNVGDTRRYEDADLSDCRASQLFQADYDRIAAVGSSPASGKMDWKAQEAVKKSTDLFDVAGLLGLTKIGMVVYVRASASDPLVWGAPNLDYNLTIAVGMDRANDKLIVRVYGAVDGLVDCECYARYDGNLKTIVTREHNSSDTPTSLIGDADRYFQGGAMYARSYTGVSPAELPTQSPTRPPARRVA